MEGPEAGKSIFVEGTGRKGGRGAGKESKNCRPKCNWGGRAGVCAA